VEETNALLLDIVKKKNGSRCGMPSPRLIASNSRYITKPLFFLLRCFASFSVAFHFSFSELEIEGQTQQLQVLSHDKVQQPNQMCGYVILVLAGGVFGIYAVHVYVSNSLF